MNRMYMVGDDVNHGNDRENDDVGGKQVEYESNGKGEQIEISESRKTGKSTDGGSSESSSGGSSDNESHASEISSTKVDDSTAGGVHMSGKEPGVPVVKIPSIEQIEPAYISSSPGNNTVSFHGDSVWNKNVGGFLNGKVVLYADIKETVSERMTNDQVILSVEETTVISQPKECLTENDSRSIHLYNVAGANPDGVVEDVKDVGVTEVRPEGLLVFPLFLFIIMCIFRFCLGTS